MIGPWQHRVHMRSLFTSMSAALRSLECADPLSRSQRSLIRADTGRGVTQDLALAGQHWRHLLLRFVQKSLDFSLGALKKKVAKRVWKVVKSSDKVAKLATLVKIRFRRFSACGKELNESFKLIREPIHWFADCFDQAFEQN